VDDRTSAQLRSLTAKVSARPTDLPVSELVELVESQSRDLTIDLTGDPAVVYSRPRRHAAFADLTVREQEVARLVASGYSNRQIADALFISLGTVKDHVHSILAKTGFASRSQVIAAWLGSPIDS
jgi:DNA-binding NarL/FixJ family response regulator